MSFSQFCPISRERVDENAGRITAFFALLITGTAIWLSLWPPALLLAVDFGLRAFTAGRWSPLRRLSQLLARSFSIPRQLTDAAPKKFAAGLGFSFSLLITLFLLLDWYWLAAGTGLVLMSCAFLESIFAYCLGCTVYTFWFWLRRQGLRLPGQD